jgi:hypothetical protein
MREQVSHRRAFRPGRVVEVDNPLLGRDERCQRGCRLGHRGPAKDVLARSVDGDFLGAAQDADGHSLRRPPLDLPQSLHGGRY